MSVEALDLGKNYGPLRALRGISCAIGPGVTGFLGPNGAGKTTLLRILATTLRPDTGAVRLFGLDPADAESVTDIRRHLGYMPQEGGVYRAFTCEQFLNYVAILKELEGRTRQSEVQRVLSAVDLGPKARTRARKLSGGMMRRLLLAQALLGNPRLLILDEPTVGLDPEQRLRFRDLISTIGEDATVVLSTHQTEDVAALCRRVVVINDGQLLFDGTPRELALAARGKVWSSGERDESALVTWRTGEGFFRNVGGSPPPDATVVEATLEDGYLLTVGNVAPQIEAAQTGSDV
jgi:ABC-2 type transport system ATP-binding protein